MKMLKLTSCMAGNADGFVESITNYVSKQIQIPIQFINNIPWQKREQQFDEGNIQICWICGLPYIWKVDSPLNNMELLVAPVLRGSRYGNKPVYFSDIVVHQESRIQTFEDLEDVCWAYNEPHSHSGCYVVRSHLSTLGKNSQFFGKIIESGAHQDSLQMILNRQVDASAIDSSVLELELKRFPEILSKIRIIKTLGPSPIPPWVISKKVPKELHHTLKNTFLEMHQNPKGQEILNLGQVSHFTHVEDRDYDPIRKMAHQAEQVDWFVNKKI